MSRRPEDSQLLSTDPDLTDEELQSEDEPGSRTLTTKGKGIGIIVALLLAVCSVGAIAYAHFKPQEANLKGAISAADAKPRTRDVVRDILQVELQRRKSMNHPSAAPDNIKELETHIRELSEATPENELAVVQAKKAQIVAAINSYGDRNVKEVADKGQAITSRMLQEINGITESPELAILPKSARKRVKTNGDMVFLKNLSVAKNDSRRLWAGNLWENAGRIGYCYHSAAPTSVRTAFTAAINHIMNLVGCVRFVQVGTISDQACAENGIFVTANNDGCWSYVGRLPSNYVQQLNLQANACDVLGIAAHEILHALGMQHEQARSDHSRYVTIHWENIQHTFWDQYALDPNGDITLDYDILSLMHYGDTDFSTWQGSVKTMTPVGNQRGVMGQRMGLSSYDATQLSNMYNCEAKRFALCTNDAAKCTPGDCECHEYTGNPLVKIERAAGCYSCGKRCPDASSYSCDPDTNCVCGVGFTKKQSPYTSTTCYACELASSAQTASPAPAPPPPSPDTCVFPTNPGNCPEQNLYGCTNCDTQNAPAWCFVRDASGNPTKARSCTVDDWACTFPFEYPTGKKHYTCITDGDQSLGYPWCYKVGGGWKLCGTKENFPEPPNNLPGMPPTPAPPAATQYYEGGGGGGGGSSR